MVDSLDCPKAALRLFTVVVLSAFVPGASGTAQESRPRGAQVHQDEAAVVHIPEPMVFDLVRGLGAVQGEAEVNVLGVFPLRTSDPHGVEWAPGIEAAVLDGFALEFELPLEDTHLEAVKFAAQYTSARRSIATSSMASRGSPSGSLMKRSGKQPSSISLYKSGTQRTS